MTKNTVIAFDGAWSHRRRAKECVVTIIDTRQKKVVDYEVVTKTKCGVPGDWDGSANGMELEALKRLLKRWVGDENVSGVVHDNDAKASKLIHDLKWKVDEYFDPNHVYKQFERRWNSCPHKHLRGVHARLQMWFRYLMQCDCSIEQKQKLWMNSLEHYKGNHKDCPREHPDSPPGGPLIKTEKAAEELQHILDETVELLARALRGLNTQLNESFNSLKAKFASKDTSWRVSWPSRIDCTVLQMNSEAEWRIPLAHACFVELDDDLIRRMNRKWADEQARRRRRATPEAQAKATRLRWERRQRDNQQTAGIHDYQIAPPRQDDGVDDELVPYEEALERDSSIAVPAEPGDDEVRMVRNRLNIFGRAVALDPSGSGADAPDGFAADAPDPSDSDEDAPDGFAADAPDPFDSDADPPDPFPSDTRSPWEYRAPSPEELAGFTPLPHPEAPLCLLDTFPHCEYADDAELIRIMDLKRRSRANHAGSTGPISPTDLTVSREAPVESTARQFRHIATQFRDSPWQYCGLPHNIRDRAARNDIWGFGSCNPGDTFDRAPVPVASPVHREAAIHCHVSPDCDLRSVLALRAAHDAALRARRGGPLAPLEVEDDLEDDDREDEDLDTDDGVLEQLLWTYRVPDDFRETGRMVGKTLVIDCISPSLRRLPHGRKSP
jgi:hypothetical protein